MRIEERLDVECGGLFSGSTGQFIILVKHNDGEDPKFRIFDRDTQKERCCIAIKRAEYVGKKHLDQQDIASLCKHLDYSGYTGEISNWQNLVNNWNLGNKKKVRRTAKRPEYEKLMFV